MNYNFQINKYLTFFYDYANSFLPSLKFRKDEYLLKIKHTEEVVKLALNFLDKKELNFIDNSKVYVDQKIYISLILSALFHDIGRFKQYYDFGTFKDNISINHGELSFKVINDSNILNGLAEKNVILNSVRYHNSKDIPDFLKINELNFNTIRILRDIDKLDIFRVVIEQHLYEKDKKTVMLHLLEKEDISNNVYEKIMNNITVSYSELEYQDDFKALQLGWIFELNLKESLVFVNEKKYHKQIYETMSKNEKSYNIFLKVEKYLNDIL